MRDFIRQSGIEFAGSPGLEAYNPGPYIIHQENGDRQFTYWRKNSAARRLADNGDALCKAMADANIIYFSGITLAILPLAKRPSSCAASVAPARGRPGGVRSEHSPCPVEFAKSIAGRIGQRFQTGRHSLAELQRRA
jgi:2-dehydro-3-deoxygluconokinase